MLINRILQISLLIVLVLFLESCTSVNEKDATGDSMKKCIEDDDCVADQCCHAKEAVNKAYAPECKSVMCTMSCEPDTIDCGQGKVACVDKKCSVIRE
jgi:hypothetical protein